MRKEISSIFGEKKVVLRETQRSVTPFGGLSVFVKFLERIGYAAIVTESMPFELSSPNAINPAETFTAFLLSVTVGARRFAHTGLLRADKALHSLIGIKRFPIDDTIRNFFKRFTMGNVCRFYEPIWQWLIGRLPVLVEGYSLDLDSTVFERYGDQEGALKGYNPKKPGRNSHHPLLAVLAEVHFVLHGWLRSGNCASSSGVVEFLKETLAMLGDRLKIRVVRADSGFFGDALLEFLEEQRLAYIIVAKMTKSIKREAASIRDWRDLDELYSVGEFRTQLFGWKRPRRFAVIRERMRENKRSAGRRLIDLPGYTYRVLVTCREDAPEEIWREYNKRADMENRICELKHDLAADSFCMKEFFATDAAFKAVLMLFNLLSEFQRATAMKQYRRPATLRSHVFLCGAILGRAGHRTVIYLSQSWGGLKERMPLIDNILSYVFPTSPKLEFKLQTCPDFADS